MKKGVIKRLLGNAKALTAAVCITSAALLGAAIQAVPSLSRARPDLLEIHDGQVKVAKSFSRWGWRVYDSVDVHGNLGDREAQEDIFQRIEEVQPRLVILSNCCPRNPPVYGGTRNRSQEERRARKWRERQKAGVELVERVFKSQIDRGDHALAELPLNSTWGVRGLAGTMLNHPNVKCVHVKRDVEGARNDNDAWVTNCEHIANELEKIDRLATARGNASRSHERSCVARAICVGYVNHLKECDPGRVRKLLRSLSVRIRNKVRTDDRDIHDLRWNEKNVAKALKRWHAVFAQEGEIEDDEQSDEEMIPHSEEPRDTDMRNPGDENVERSVPPTEQVKSRLSTEGVAFEVPPGKHLSEGVREGLIKAHCNLGHPSPSDLERLLKLGGARQDVVEAVRWMKCLTCAHSRRPSTHRVSSIPPCQVTFGDEVQLDCICVHDSNKESFWYLSILDRATSYHILELLRDHTPLELHRAFDRAWMKWAGPPLKVTVDLEGGFQGRQFWEEVTQAGTSISAVAGTAHWQAGKVERHNQTVKDMLMGSIRHTQPKGREQMRKLAREVCWTKNSLVREHGWAPVSLVFGKEPRIYGELHQGGNATAYHPAVGDQGSELAHRMRYRYHAKMEFIKSQARQMLLRTAHNRTRRLPIPKIGQLVFFWRAENSKKRDSQSRWIGPGYVVGLQGGNAWVAAGGRCFLVAGEHLREAVGDEKHFGEPVLQQAISLFRKIPKEAPYENLLGQTGPANEPEALEQEEFARELAQDVDVDVETVAGLSLEHARMSRRRGWHVDRVGNPVLVSHKVWSFRSPEPEYESHKFPFRTSWVYREGKWECLERQVKWLELEQQHQFIPNGPAAGLITIFENRNRKEVCLDDVPMGVKRRKATSSDAHVHAVYQKATQSKNKLKKMMEKEIPFDKIPQEQRSLYKAAEEKEWNSWLEYDSCEILSPEASEAVEQERPERILPSRYVFRNKNAGLRDANGNELPVKAKARLCIQGHLCPDSRSGQVQVDSPTIERVSTMVFLHQVISLGWVGNWCIGDISNAFLQGAPLKDKPDMFMRQPKQGLPGLKPGQLLKLLKPVYGRPDAPRAWYDELSRILETELGFSKCQVDPAMFALRDSAGALRGLMIVHVDDVMIAHDGSTQGANMVEALCARFPFGTWMKVSEQQCGVSYCGKEIKLDSRDGEQCIVLTQNAFIDGRLQPMQISGARAKELDCLATDIEKTDFRSVVGSLQWLTVQSRPDVAFECNQLQKRVSDLRVRDLLRANKAVKEVIRNRFEIVFKSLGHDAELVTFHDAGLYSSVGVELDERECEDLLQQGHEKKLVYSQKGACVGFVKRGSTSQEGRAHFNLIDWKSATNRRVVESSFAAETHGALMAQNMSRFAQVLLGEIRYGSEIISAVEDDGWQQLCPVTLVTDCRSIYDTVHKDGQHVGEKGSIVHAVLLRQLLTTREGQEASGKARLKWVPTRCQLADGLTKANRGADLREQLSLGLLFQEKAIKRRSKLHVQPTGQKESVTSVKVQ